MRAGQSLYYSSVGKFFDFFVHVQDTKELNSLVAN